MTVSVKPLSRFLGPWWLVALLGASSLLLGILALTWPGRTLVMLVVVIGIHLFAFGLLRLSWAISDSGLPQRGLIAMMGVLGVVAGLLVVRQPFRTLGIFVVVLGLYWVFSGLSDVFSAITDENHPQRRLLLTLGVMSAIAGALVLMWPAATLVAVAVVAGIHLIIAGIVQLMIGMRLRKEPEMIISVETMATVGAAPLAEVAEASIPPKRAAPTTARASSAAMAAAAMPDADPDDLTTIEGIGPKIQLMLQDEGIKTFVDLASAPVDRLNVILEAAGSRFRVHDPTTWPEQATLAAAGNWTELEALRDNLHGGRE